METLLFHPKLVHVPIALAVLMPLLAGGLAVAWWRKWLPWRGWIVAVALQTVLLGSGALALRSGDAQAERVERVVPEAALEQHEEAAEAFVWASGIVLAMMIAAAALRSRRVGLPVAALATAGTLVVTGLGYRAGEAGGRLVYQHGAAQVYAQPTGGTAVAGARTGDDD
jgi:hypothetical protein